MCKKMLIHSVLVFYYEKFQAYCKEMEEFYHEYLHMQYLSFIIKISFPCFITDQISLLINFAHLFMLIKVSC